MHNKRPKSHRRRTSPNRKENLLRILLIIVIVIAGIILPRLLHSGSNLLIKRIARTNIQETESETEEEGMYSTGSGSEENSAPAEADHSSGDASEPGQETGSPQSEKAQEDPSQTDQEQTRQSEPESKSEAGESSSEESGMVSVGIPDGGNTNTVDSADTGNTGDSTDASGSGSGQDTSPSDGGDSNSTAQMDNGSPPGSSTAEEPGPQTSNGNNVTEDGVSLLADDVVMSGPEIQIPPSGTAESVNTDGMTPDQINEAQANANYVAKFSPRIVLATDAFEEDLLGTGDADGQVFLKRLGTYVVDTFGNWISVPTVEIRERLSGSREFGSINYRIKLYVENETGETEEHFAIVTYYPDIGDYSVYYADTKD